MQFCLYSVSPGCLYFLTVKFRQEINAQRRLYVLQQKDAFVYIKVWPDKVEKKNKPENSC